MPNRRTALVLISIASAAGLLSACGGSSTGSTSTAAAPAGGGDATILDCSERAIGGRIVARPQRDSIHGPLAFSRARENYLATLRGLAGRDGSREVKVLALVEPAGRVAVAVPADERGWLRLLYLGGRPSLSVTFEPCRGKSGNGAPSQYPGGFEIDFGKAPRRALCMRLSVRVDGAAPESMFPFAPVPGGCRDRL